MNRYLPLIMIVTIVSLLVMVLFYSGNITGLATTGSSAKGISEIEPKAPEAAECVSEEADKTCGSSCWLDEDGFRPSTFQDSKGKIGVIDWNGKCRDVLNSINPENQLCCGDCDCSLDYKCDKGVCIMP